MKSKTSILRAGAWAAPMVVGAAIVALGSSGAAAAPQASNATPGQQVSGAAAGQHASNATLDRPADSTAEPYLPGTVLVGYRSTANLRFENSMTTSMGLRSEGTVGPAEQVLRLPKGVTVDAAIASLRRTPGVAYALPDYLAHVAGASPHEWIPNDPGRSSHPRGWEKMQWNFLRTDGVDVPEAWSNLRADGRPGAKGVVVAIVDTGVAYRRWKRYRRSPDFNRTEFVDPYDFVAHNHYPLDRLGHGTFVAGTVAESTNNHLGLTGIAYRAKIMPVRVLNRNGEGSESTIARGIRYAVKHGAQVINLSMQFPLGIAASQIPEMLSALNYARSRKVVVVAAAGNESSPDVTYPAAAPGVIAVGATTADRCLARYSNRGARVNLVAPGGGRDANIRSDPDCHPGRKLPSIFQMTFPNPNRPQKFGFPRHWFGTSMASPEVAGVAALVIASGVLGRHPTPDQVLARLEQTARPLGGAQPNTTYGWGMLDAGAATARG